MSMALKYLIAIFFFTQNSPSEKNNFGRRKTIIAGGLVMAITGIYFIHRKIKNTEIEENIDKEINNLIREMNQKLFCYKTVDSDKKQLKESLFFCDLMLHVNTITNNSKRITTIQSLVDQVSKYNGVTRIHNLCHDTGFIDNLCIKKFLERSDYELEKNLPDANNDISKESCPAFLKRYKLAKEILTQVNSGS
jgi:enoyl-[acyl-carrier-protein] reductase (NADH)